MLKKATMLAVVAGALVALTVPATAPAFWTKDHQLLTQNAEVEITGTSAFHGQIGSVECQVRSILQLTAGTTTAHVTTSDIDLLQPGSTVTQKCSISPSLELISCTDMSSVTSAALPWVAHAVSTQTVVTTTGTIQLHLHGGIFCPKTIQLTPGALHSNMSTSNTWTTGQVSGKLYGHMGATEQQVEITGHGVVGSGVYGVA